MEKQGMRRDLIDRFTSRKFLLAVATLIAAILGTAGVIDTSTEAQLAGYIAGALYIIVEGIRDILSE